MESSRVLDIRVMGIVSQIRRSGEIKPKYKSPVFGAVNPAIENSFYPISLLPLLTLSPGYSHFH